MTTANGATPGFTSASPAGPSATSAALREVMRSFATGVVVLTTAGERCHGMTANSFSSVSLDPPLVLCCVSRSATMHEAITVTQRFAVSILDADQEHLARYFTDRRRPRGSAQFEQVDSAPGPVTGSPVLGGALASLECVLTESYLAGDHSIFIGEVVGSHWRPAATALLFFGGHYHELSAAD